jgi:menaquinone-dependent protoporphyrinogen IX oxidase
MNTKILIAFATKSGATEDTARKIADTLTGNYGLEVNLINLSHQPSPDFSQYGSIVIGSGIRMKKWYKEAAKFLENDFRGKNVALFVSSMYDGGNPETYPVAVARYLEKISSEQLNVKPLTMEAFGGRMKFLGRVTQDNRNLETIKKWSENLGKNICTPQFQVSK